MCPIESMLFRSSGASNPSIISKICRGKGSGVPSNGNQIGGVTDRTGEELDEDEQPFWAMRIGKQHGDMASLSNAEFATLQEAKKWVEEIEAEHA